VNKLTHYIFKI